MAVDLQYDTPHPSTVRKDEKYHCHNKSRPIPGHAVKATNGESWPFRLAVDCKYDRSDNDSRCSGCKHAIKVKTVVDWSDIVVSFPQLSKFQRSFKKDHRT